MRRPLILHPAFQCPAVTAVTVEVTRHTTNQLSVYYRLAGDPTALHLPRVTKPARADGLWKSTCFELFLRPAAGPAYYEFNFAPTTEWAAYHFDDYRQGMAPAIATAPPMIAVRPWEGGFDMEVLVDLKGASELDPKAPLHLGVSAVIETADGATSYWALAHPSGRPDFHHADGFALDLAPTGRS